MGNTHGKQSRYIDWERAERPSPPGKPCLAPDTSEIPDLIKIQWSPPNFDGGAPIIGYLVEHRRTGSPHWLRASPHLAEDTSLVLSGLEPGWRYQFRVSAENDIGRSDPSEVSEPLTVLLQRSAACAPHFNQELQDIVALENETVELKVHFLGTPAPQISWFKDGFELFSNRRTKIITENDTSSLIIYQAAVEDEGEIKCAITNRAGHSITKSSLRLLAPPRIRLPRQYEDGLIFERGEVIRLKIASAGRPPPEVTWFHNGEQLVTAGRVEVTSIEHGSSVRIRDACRDDRGEYSVRGVNYIGEDIVSFLVTITDRPSAPGRPQVTMALGKTVTLTWTEPEEDGGCKIGAFIVEYFRIGWDMWLKAATSRLLTAQLADLIEGSQYKFRVKAENPYGVSEPSEESDVVFVPDAKRGVLTPPPTQPHQAWLVAVEEDSRKRQVATDNETDAAKRRRRLEESARRLLDGEVIRSAEDEDMSGVEDDFSSRRRRLLDENARRLLDTPLDVLLSSPRPPGPVEKPPRRKRDSRSPSVSPGRTDDTPPVPKRRSKQKTQEDVPTLALPVSPARLPEDGIPAASITHGTPMGTAGRMLQGLPYGPELSPPPVRSPRISPPMSPALLRDDSITHGSSELMLVLYPEETKPRGMPLTPQHRSEVELRLLEPAIAPPLSLSSPELGSDEPYEMPLLRNAVSSTELLHERAMARLYQDAAEEEMLKMQIRRKSLERRPSLRETGVERRSSFKESALARRSSFKETVERKHSFKEEIVKAIPAKVEEVKAPVKKLMRMSSEEKEQMEFAKIREKLRLKNEASVKVPEPRIRPVNLKQESSMSSQLSSYDGETGSEYYEGEVEDVSGEEEDYEEEEDMGEDEEDELVEEFMQRLREEVKDSKAFKDRKSPVASTPPAVPVHGILKKGSRFEDEETKKKQVEEDTYHPRSMVPTHSEIKEIPIAVPVQSLPLLSITFNDEPEEKAERPEKTKQDEFDEALVLDEPPPPSPLPAKRKSKLFSKIGFGRKKDKKPVETLASDSLPLTTSIILPKPILKKKSLKKREKKDKTSNESASPSPDRTAEKKQVRIAEPGSGGLGVPTTDDPKVSPLTKKRNELKQRRQQSIEEEEEANKIIINHYSDIVKEYGGPKRQPPKLYLDLEELEAHAPDIPEPLLIPEVPEMPVGGSDQEERGSAPDISSVDADLRSLLDVAEFVEPPDYEEPPLEPEIEPLPEPEQEPVVPEEPTPEERPHSPSPTSSHSSNAEEVVRDTVDYLIDVAIVLFAFWLYIFKSEIYVIPVLVILVYRQLQQAVAKKYRAAKRAISDKIPKSLTGSISKTEDDKTE